MLDEFNRATPRMQSGLLEAMEEHAVTVGKRRHALPRPFFFIGTMNPHDNSGTFEMAHASATASRCAPASATRRRTASATCSCASATARRREESDPIVAPGDVVKLQKVIAQLPAGEPVRAYLVRLLRSTREHPDVLVGASPRALLSMYRCAQAAALLDNAAEVAVKHVRSLFEPCIAHRIRVRAEASARARLRGDPRAHAGAGHDSAADDPRPPGAPSRAPAADRRVEPAPRRARGTRAAGEPAGARRAHDERRDEDASRPGSR